MRVLLTCISTALFLVAPISIGAPIEGGSAKFEEIGTETWKVVKRFRGGERAVILAANKSKTAAQLHVSVFDDKGNLVAEDKNKAGSVEDMVGVVWYPSRDHDYRIEIKNLEGNVSSCYITIK